MWTTWRLTALSTIITVLLLAHPSAATGDSTNYSAVLDDAERLVQDVAKLGLENYLNAEELLRTCDDVHNCSRRVCAPSSSDFPLSCESVPRNTDCNVNNSTCTRLSVSRERAYVWWSTDADLMSERPTCEMTSSICAQRQLDTQIYKRASPVIDFNVRGFVYFGDSNGLLRMYPGRELNASTCNQYELLARPWFASAWAVEKEVVVLLDAGPEMGKFVTLNLPGHPTFFDAARNITKRLMTTLTNSDSLSVITFDGYGATVLEPKINVITTVSADDLQSLLPLSTQVERLPSPDASSSRRANLTAALVKGRDRFSAQTLQMKVFIIITYGDLVGPEDLDPDLLSSLSILNVTVFIYRLLPSSNESTVDGNSISRTLRNSSCYLNGWYEEIRYNPQSPLSSLKSFYSYMALLRYTVTGGKPYWVPRFASRTHYSDVITACYPVFNGSFLVGVCAHEILVDNLQSVSDDGTSLLATRNLVYSASIPVPPPIRCNQTLSQPTNHACVENVTGLCVTDVESTTTAFQARVCCGYCIASKSRDRDKVGAIVGGVVGSIVLLLSIIVLGCVYYLKKKPKKPFPPISPIDTPINVSTEYM